MPLSAALPSSTGPTLLGWHPVPPRPRTSLGWVGRYRLLSLLDQGASGEVYRAEEHPGGRPVAVKVLSSSLVAHPPAVARFLDEVRSARALRHPNVIEVLDWGSRPGGGPFLVMELLRGEKLTCRLAQTGALPPPVAVDYAVQTASALAAIHDRGIVHRDLKPDNLFLVAGGAPGRCDRIKVLDFGEAKRPGAVEAYQTHAGALIGTPLYMSPEQCEGARELDARSDLYALGLILYEMLCGLPPFAARTLSEIIHMHRHLRPPRLRGRAPSVPRRLAAVVHRALAKRPADRFSSAAEMAAAARAALA
jgi:serine/threonine protein kinase